MGGKCQCCGYNKCVDALEIHHLDPEEKSFTVSALRANHGSWDSIVKELRKCVMLCGICHAEYHAGMREIPADAQRFNEEYVDYKALGKEKSFCPICKEEKEEFNKTCSYKCAAVYKAPIDWSKYDLKKMYVDEKKTQTEIGTIVGLSDVAVSKRLKKLGLK